MTDMLAALLLAVLVIAVPMLLAWLLTRQRAAPRTPPATPSLHDNAALPHRHHATDFAHPLDRHARRNPP